MKGSIILILLFLFQLVAVAQSVDGYIQKGNEYYRQSAYELAERQYRRALETAPQNSTALYNLANTLYQQKKYDEAESILNQITKAPSDNTNIKAAAYYNAGVIYSKERDLPASIEAYKNALRINPNDKQARENLQKAMAELRNQRQNKSQQNQSSNMSQKQAEQKLKELAEKERQLQQRLQDHNAKNGNNMEQDW